MAIHSQGTVRDLLDLSPDAPTEPYVFPPDGITNQKDAIAVGRHVVICGPSQCCYHPLGGSQWKCFDMAAASSKHRLQPAGQKGGFWILGGKEEEDPGTSHGERLLRCRSQADTEMLRRGRELRARARA